MSFRVLGTNHTSFTVSNLDRSLGFFRDCLGFEVVSKARPCDTGFAHVAFNVDDAQAAVAAVQRYGVRPIAPPVTIDQGPNKGRKVVYVRDWDGVTIEFIEVAAQ